MSAPAGTPRTVQIASPSAGRESAMVARAVFFLVYASALLISGQSQAQRGAEAAPLSAFERSFHDLDAPDQRLYRALREGMIEAEARRSTTGAWPAVEALAKEGIPPFAPDPIDRARYVWTAQRGKLTSNYVGTPSEESGRKTVVVVITEPEPGTPSDPLAPVDEVHHRLGDGAMIHVTVWMGPPLPTTGEPLSVLPIERGYQQIVNTSGKAP
jgi:hypothetical protein